MGLARLSILAAVRKKSVGVPPHPPLISFFVGTCATFEAGGGPKKSVGVPPLFLIPGSAPAVRAPVFGRHQFFGPSEHYGKAHGSLLSGWINYNYTACCWFPTSSNILILPSQFWQIRFESYWLHCSKCRILVLLLYLSANKICETMYKPINTTQSECNLKHSMSLRSMMVLK